MAFFNLIQTPDTLKKKAKQDFDKVVSLKGEGRTERSLRVRMSMLTRAHLDKTFIDGAQKTADHQDLLMVALAAGKSVPEEPQHTVYQQIGTSNGKAVWAYLPDEYAELIFQLGRRYQRMEITAEQSIETAQQLLDQIVRYEFKIEEELTALQFLSDEIAHNVTTDSDEAIQPDDNTTNKTDPDTG
jgi:hypothetical protein